VKYTVHFLEIFSLSLSKVATMEVLLHNKPTSTRHSESLFPLQFNLPQFKEASKCWIPASMQASHFLKMFLHI